MNDGFNDANNGWESDSFAEAIWETLIVLVITVAIGLGTVSLATHLKEIRMVRDTAESHVLQFDGSNAGLSGLARVHAGEEPHLN
jgi:hypothetical protein